MRVLHKIRALVALSGFGLLGCGDSWEPRDWVAVQDDSGTVWAPHENSEGEVEFREIYSSQEGKALRASQFDEVPQVNQPASQNPLEALLYERFPFFVRASNQTYSGESPANSSFSGQSPANASFSGQSPRTASYQGVASGYVQFAPLSCDLGPLCDALQPGQGREECNAARGRPISLPAGLDAPACAFLDFLVCLNDNPSFFTDLAAFASASNPCARHLEAIQATGFDFARVL